MGIYETTDRLDQCRPRVVFHLEPSRFPIDPFLFPNTPPPLHNAWTTSSIISNQSTYAERLIRRPLTIPQNHLPFFHHPPIRARPDEKSDIFALSRQPADLPHRISVSGKSTHCGSGCSVLHHTSEYQIHNEYITRPYGAYIGYMIMNT